MNKLDRFRFGNLHKRRFFVLLAVVIALLMIAICILFAIGAFGDRSELVRLKVTNNNTGNSISGVGINLDYVPSTNRVSDASFECEYSYTSYTVAASDTGTVFINPHEANGIVNGNSIRVYSIDSNENMSCVYESIVAGYDALSFGQVTEIADITMLEHGDVVKTVVVDGIVDALTSDGVIVTDVLAGQVDSFVEADDSVFVDIANTSSGVYAVDLNGVFYYSNDGHSFSAISNNSYEDIVPVKLLCVDSAIAACCEDGSIILLAGDTSILTEAKVNDVTYTAGFNDEVALFINSSNEAYITSNFVAYRKLDIALIDDSVIDIVATNGSFFIIHESGAISILTFDGDEADVSVLSADSTGLSGGYIDAIAYENGIVAVNTYKSAILITPENGIRTLSGESTSIEDVYLGSGQRILYHSGNRLMATQLLAGIRVIDTLGEGLISAGDVCTIGSRLSPVEVTLNADLNNWRLSINRGTWDLYGAFTSLAVVPNDDTNTGDYCARVTGSSEGLHVLSQELVGTAADNFADDTFYRMELKLRQDGLSHPVNVWISGDNYESEGFTIDNVSSRFSSYSYVFVVPGSMINDGSIRFNVGFEGEGVLYIDNIYLGEDRYDSSMIREDFVDRIADANPSAIRLNNLMLGNSGYSKAEFYGMTSLSGAAFINDNAVSSCKSLEQSLRLVREAQSNPWLVIGSVVSTEDINNLMEYLCGFNSSTYSTLRVENGTSMPWGQQFDRFYIEINDVDGLFMNDLQRGAYVDYIINLIEQSEYYVDLRDKLVFVDGMNYEGEMIISSADYHASALDINYFSSSSDTFENIVLNAYFDAAHEVPRASTHSNSSGELVSSLNVTSDVELTAADYFVSLYNTNSTYLNMTMINITDDGLPIRSETLEDSNNKVALNVVSSLSILKKADYRLVEVNDPSGNEATDSAEAFVINNAVSCFTTDDGNYLIVANLSDTQQQFIVDLMGNMSIDTVRRYSETGSAIRRNRTGVDNTRQVIQAGQYVIIKCD